MLKLLGRRDELLEVLQFICIDSSLAQDVLSIADAELRTGDGEEIASVFGLVVEVRIVNVSDLLGRPIVEDQLVEIGECANSNCIGKSVYGYEDQVRCRPRLMGREELVVHLLPDLRLDLNRHARVVGLECIDQLLQDDFAALNAAGVQERPHAKSLSLRNPRCNGTQCKGKTCNPKLLS